MANAVQYDARVIGEFAARLYARARSIVISYTVLGVLLGLVAGALAGARALVAAGGDVGGDNMVGIVIGAVIGGMVGFSIGTEKAFLLRLQAQTALCQAQIEANTRAVAETAERATGLASPSSRSERQAG
jgi:hypothetical protein